MVAFDYVPDAWLIRSQRGRAQKCTATPLLLLFFFLLLLFLFLLFLFLALLQLLILVVLSLFIHLHLILVVVQQRYGICAASFGQSLAPAPTLLELAPPMFRSPKPPRPGGAATMPKWYGGVSIAATVSPLVVVISFKFEESRNC